MVKLSSIVVTLLIAAIGIAAPIVFVLGLARQQGLEAEQTRALEFAGEALAKTEATFDSFLGVVTQLAPMIVGEPCEVENLNLMEYAALRTRDVKALGYVSGNQLVCSSMNIDDRVFDLGEPLVSGLPDTQMSVRNDVYIPRLGELEFLVLQKGNIAGVVQAQATLENVTRGAQVNLAVFSADSSAPLLKNGDVSADWLQAPPDAGDTRAFLSDGYIVGVARAARSGLTAVAAIPRAALDRRTRELTGYLLPVGAVAGAVLIWAILFLSRHQMALPQAIRAALRAKQFFLVYQPIVDLETGRWTGAEALIRWRRPNGEVISPEVFMPAAEESGLIHDVTERLFQLAARDARDLFRDFPDFHISLNVSARDIHDAGIVERLVALKQQMHAGDGNLFVEITERGLTRPEQAISIIHALRESGIPVAVDDFGTGYSSLSYLESFDLDYLKIDKFFVDCIDSEDEAVTGKVLTHIIELARSLDLRMIAEGVETTHQRDQLRRYGVQFAQGWLYAKPLRMAELRERLGEEAG
ncbi:EAL domain-containing protein [Mangrovimicrobium sediminis]|uniref:cyclic-guanylate-specific phosphodiesterase n=1 Tax=Mangrovimicrobium sediminis TaxID=2562682 RepID=A0A4Z0M2G7_9GAMM|nr:EAL domain-containing protein [Haliea sp. SAOS-164]TGD73485.1 EAL domain-containing protein [Haliea sp. SAOS-164]